jgi:hypothetical protein
MPELFLIEGSSGASFMGQREYTTTRQYGDYVLAVRGYLRLVEKPGNRNISYIISYIKLTPLHSYRLLVPQALKDICLHKTQTPSKVPVRIKPGDQAAAHIATELLRTFGCNLAREAHQSIQFLNAGIWFRVYISDQRTTRASREARPL